MTELEKVEYYYAPNFRTTSNCMNCVHANLEYTDHLHFNGCKKHPDQKWQYLVGRSIIRFPQPNQTICDDHSVITD